MPSMLAALSTMGGGAPEPEPLPSLDMPDSAQLPYAPSGEMPSVHPLPAAPTGSGKVGGLHLVRELAPLLMAAVAGMKNPSRGAALAHGYANGALRAQQETMAEQERADHLQQLGTEFMRQTAADVMRLKDPIERQQYLQFAHDIGVQQFNLPADWTKKVPAHDAKEDVFAKLKGELSEKLKAFDADKKWATVAGTPGEGKISFRLSNGQTVPVNKARQLVGQAVFDESGGQAFAPAAPVKPEKDPPTDYSRGLERYAKGIGKTLDTITTADELAFKKQYGQADDRPLKGTDPIVEAIRALTLANLQKTSGGELAPGQATAGGKLSDDFRAESKDFIQVSQAYNRVQASAKDPSAAGDLALIFNYMKTLDPGSTVREGEFATAQNSGSVGSRIAAQYNKIVNGERLSPEMRADFLDRSKRLYTQALGQHNRIKDQYRRKAKAVNVPEDFVLTDYGLGDDDAPAKAGGPSKATLRFNPVTGKVEKK